MNWADCIIAHPYAISMPFSRLEAIMTIIIFLAAAVLVFLLSNYLVLLVGFGPFVTFCAAISLLLLAIALYDVRARSRLLYGIVELAVGS